MDYIRFKVKAQSADEAGGIKAATIKRMESTFTVESNDLLKVMHALSKRTYTHTGFPYTLDFTLE